MFKRIVRDYQEIPAIAGNAWYLLRHLSGKANGFNRVLINKRDIRNKLFCCKQESNVI